jgi:hypothetical protein
MRRWLLRMFLALWILCLSGLTPLQAANPEGASPARYPALAYTTAIIILIMVVAIVAFPSRKETWDQRIERKRRRDARLTTPRASDDDR